MKTLLLILFYLCLQYPNTQGTSDNEINLRCSINSRVATYKIGEIPDIQVEIANNSQDDIYLIGALDGSDIKRRMPYCYFTIEKPKPDTVIYSICGFTNPLRVEECRLVKSGEIFNPYAQIDKAGYWTDYMIHRKETFQNPGLYKIQFHYSTNSADIHNFLGSWNQNPDTPQLKKLIDKVPKIELVSNVLEIKIVE